MGEFRCAKQPLDYVDVRLFEGLVQITLGTVEPDTAVYLDKTNAFWLARELLKLAEQAAIE